MKCRPCKSGYKHTRNCGCTFLKNTGYNSHGRWSTLKELKEIEQERGNPFPRTKLPGDTPAIWINFDKKKTLRYMISADEWDDIEAGKLTRKQKEMLKDIHSIPLRPTDKILFDDGDEGYLLIRPKG